MKRFIALLPTYGVVEQEPRPIWKPPHDLFNTAWHSSHCKNRPLEMITLQLLNMMNKTAEYCCNPSVFRQHVDCFETFVIKEGVH